MGIDTSKKLSHRDLESPVSEFMSQLEYVFTVDQTIEEALYILQSKKIPREPKFFYITNRENVLQGIISVYDLIYSSPKTRLINCVDAEALKISENESLEKALQLLTHHKILMLPVVDKENRLLGKIEVIHHEEDSAHPPKRLNANRQKEDVFQFIGFSIEQRKWASPWTEFRNRMPWLLCNLVGGLICAVIGEFFQATLIQFVILALFIPLVLTLSESIAIQSMTLSLRFLHVKKVNWGQVWKRIILEWRASLFLGVTSAFLIGCFYFAWSTEIMPVIAIGVSMVVAMIASASFGALFPIILHALQLDPKVAAGPVVLMMADIVTVSIYFSLSTALLINAT